ncbi:MAG: stage II sporulation protein M [Alphaproteobacteria bacterium]|nr:MAG: stage II sporulation protein M [Alphaproteobacteria bacterium]
MATPGTKSYQFRMERQEGWLQLEDYVRRAEKDGIAALSAREVFELPHLYRGALSSLSVARSISLDRNVVDYLENLTARAYFLLYGHQRPAGQAFMRLLARSVPDAVRSISREFLIITAVFLIGLFAAFFLVLENPDWYFTFIDQSMAQGRQPGASVEDLREPLYAVKDVGDGLDVFATQLFTHNAQVGLMAFALGFALGIPTLWLVFANGSTLGAFLALYYSKGLLFEIGGWLIIHGSTEILAILLCGAAGLAIARHYIFPGRMSRLQALAVHGRKAALVAFGCLLMFLLAGLLEGFGRQQIVSDGLRYGIGIFMLGLWTLYYLRAGRGPEEDEA